MTRRTFGRIERLPSGRYRARYQNPNNKTERIGAPQTFLTKKAAQSWLNGIDSQISAGKWKHPDELAKEEAEARELQARQDAWEEAEREKNQTTVSEWVDEWLALLEASVEAGDTAHGTFRSYRSAIKPFVAALGDVPVREVMPEDIESWWQAQSVARGRDGKVISANTRKARYQAVAVCMAKAQDRGIIPHSPAQVRGAGKRIVKREQPMEYVPTPEDIARLVEASNARTGAAIILAYYCGLRSGEIRALTPRDLRLDGDRPHIVVRRAVARTASGAERLTGTKTAASNRDAPCPPIVVNHLRAYLVAEGIEQPGQFIIVSQGDKSNPVRGSALLEGRGGFHEACDAIGLHPSITRLHDLRTAFLTRAGWQGATIKELMDLAGHSDPDSVMRYQIATLDRLYSLVRAIGG